MVTNVSNISKNITFKEAVKSITAQRLGIKNEPTKDQLSNMCVLAAKIFQPMRSGLGNNPIHISSFFRSFLLNNAIGGANKSQHMANNGAAMDIDVDGSLVLFNYQIFEFIRISLDFDQLIWEFGDEFNPEWVHVSYNGDKNRKQILKAIKEDGKTKYLPYEQS